MNYTSKHLLLGQKAVCWDNPKPFKGFKEFLTSAVVFERRCLPVDGILFQQVTVRKDTATEGGHPLRVHNRTHPRRAITASNQGTTTLNCAGS